MAAERTAQHFRQIHREAEPGAAYAKSVHQALGAPDAAWRALVANPDRPSIAASLGIPVNAFAGRVAWDEIAAPADPAVSLPNRAGGRQDAEWLVLLANSARPSIGAGLAAPINSIADLLERPPRALPRTAGY